MSQAGHFGSGGRADHRDIREEGAEGNRGRRAGALLSSLSHQSGPGLRHRVMTEPIGWIGREESGGVALLPQFVQRAGCGSGDDRTVWFDEY
ncbi:hypothetical protein XFLAVUS301_42860 [Xanthobacter flavus]|uniref:Uncharacterized protein n=1 Tax=Xanthobacter flavus TaxID=281 RepID=A0A9W6CR00_XANFL|nr:hypothetical protein XFLAVUS301_42860 [Xanthobacter flavus]